MNTLMFCSGFLVGLVVFHLSQPKKTTPFPGQYWELPGGLHVKVVSIHSGLVMFAGERIEYVDCYDQQYSIGLNRFMLQGKLAEAPSPDGDNLVPFKRFP